MNRHFRPLRSMPTTPWRVLAASLAAMVLGLMLAGSSPDLHAWLHGEATPHNHGACEHSPSKPGPSAASEGHRCAVVLFAHGAELPLHATFVSLPLAVSGRNERAPDALYLASPRYLRHPERGPPAA